MEKRINKNSAGKPSRPAKPMFVAPTLSPPQDTDWEWPRDFDIRASHSEQQELLDEVNATPATERVF